MDRMCRRAVEQIAIVGLTSVSALITAPANAADLIIQFNATGNNGMPVAVNGSLGVSTHDDEGQFAFSIPSTFANLTLNGFVTNTLLEGNGTVNLFRGYASDFQATFSGSGTLNTPLNQSFFYSVGLAASGGRTGSISGFVNGNFNFASLNGGYTLAGSSLRSGATGFQILDGATSSSSFSFGNVGTVRDLELDLLNISHTYAGDLTFSLSHLGTTVIFADPYGNRTAQFGSPTDLKGNYAFSDATVPGFETALAHNTILAGGDYGTSGLFSIFDGMDRAGEWILSVTDHQKGDQGSLGGWGLNFGTSAAPEPTSWAMIIWGFGAVGATLRGRRSTRNWLKTPANVVHSKSHG